MIGAGLAGSEAAWQAAEAGVAVNLYEMRPKKTTEAHHTNNFAELVCTNSLRGNNLTNAVGVLKRRNAPLEFGYYLFGRSDSGSGWWCTSR